MTVGNKAALLYLLFATGWYVVLSHSNLHHNPKGWKAICW